VHLETPARIEVLEELPSGDAAARSSALPTADGERVAAPMRDSVEMVGGALGISLGAVVLAGWHTGDWRLIQVYAGSTPMAYLTAVTFVGMGLAVVALGTGRQTLARWGALVFVPVCIGRLIWPSPASASPMAPNTAVAFILLAAALWCRGARRTFRGQATAIVLCAAASAALGLNALTSHLTGLHTSAWGGFTAMAVHTSAGLLVLSSAILTSAWKMGRPDRRERRTLALVVVAVTGGVTTLSLWQALATTQKVQMDEQIAGSQLPLIVLIFGLATTGLAAAAVYLAQTARLRTAVAEHLRETAEKEILERKRAAEALEDSERKYRTLLENLPQKIAHKDRNSVYVSCNRCFASDLKIAAGEIRGRTDFDFFPREMAEKYRADDRSVMESGNAAEIEEEYFWNGERRSVQTVKTPVRDENGRITGIIVIFWDVTDRKRAEEAVRRAAVYNRGLLEASLDPLVTISPAGKLTDVNRAAEVATGRGRDELIGADFSEFFTDPEKARLGYLQVFRDGSVQDYELGLRRRDGYVRPVLYNASVYRDESGSVAGVFAAARDITERKRAEEELELKARELARSNSDLEQFAYVASHDLQEPLRMVANFTQLLADRYKDQVGEEGAEFIAYAVDGATRMQRLIEDLLTFSRVGTRGKSFEAADCNEVLGRAVANLRVAIEESGAFVGHDELPTVRADASQLTQLFQNLLGNAIKFRSGAPRILASAEKRGSEWVFSIRDNGIGIDPKFRERIFVIFQRLHGRGEYPGTGIGLAVCKKIVERHGGRIWVESEPGKGSTFFFTLSAD
jgi:PAS domain S-box-containing protein